MACASYFKDNFHWPTTRVLLKIDNQICWSKWSSKLISNTSKTWFTSKSTYWIFSYSSKCVFNSILHKQMLITANPKDVVLFSFLWSIECFLISADHVTRKNVIIFRDWKVILVNIYSTEEVFLSALNIKLSRQLKRNPDEQNS